MRASGGVSGGFGENLNVHGGAGNGSEGEVLCGRALLLAPLVEKPAVAEGDVMLRGNAEALGDAVDPIRGPFQFGEVADGRFVDHAMAFAVVPLRAPLFIAERRGEAERAKHRGQGFAIGDLGFRFNTVLVGIFARA